jgi:hypothetical protein
MLLADGYALQRSRAVSDAETAPLKNCGTTPIFRHISSDTLGRPVRSVSGPAVAKKILVAARSSGPFAT